jgi:hypothetical protein
MNFLKLKSEKSPFVLSPGWIFWISAWRIPYILFKLEEIKKNEAFSMCEHAFKAV